MRTLHLPAYPGTASSTAFGAQRNLQGDKGEQELGSGAAPRSGVASGCFYRECRALLGHGLPSGGETSLVTALWKRATSAGERGLSAWKRARHERFLHFPSPRGRRKEKISLSTGKGICGYPCTAQGCVSILMSPCRHGTAILGVWRWRCGSLVSPARCCSHSTLPSTFYRVHRVL